MAALIAALPAVFVHAHDPPNSTVSWTGEIGPLVQARCTVCHVAGGRGPMPLTTYGDARPWAKAIREEVLTRRMPKWHAARGYGAFANDRSLTPFEIALIVAWVDGGSRKDPPQPQPVSPKPGPLPVSAGPGDVGKPPLDRGGGGGPTQRITLPCGDRRLPRGRLLALKPALGEGGEAGISLVLPDGRQEVLAWIRDFERKFAETYWLSTPIEIPAGSRLRVNARGPCRITLTFQ